MTKPTVEKILAMKPGRELDMLVAEKVMGWMVKVREIVWSVDKHGFTRPLPFFSSDIKDAWQVVESIKGRRIAIEKTLSGSFYCCIGHSADGHKPVDYQAKTAPEAICKAALLALEGEKE